MLGDREGSMWHVQMQGFARLHAKRPERPCVDERRSAMRAKRLLPPSAAAAAAAAGCRLNCMTLPATLLLCELLRAARLMRASAPLTMLAEPAPCLATRLLRLLQGLSAPW